MDHEVEVRRELGMALRVAVQAMSRLAEQRARRREQQMRAIEQASRERAQQLREEFAAQRNAAEARVKPVFEPTWIDNADSQRITDTYLLAREWSAHSPVAEAAAADIRHRVWERTGVDIEAQVQAAATNTERQQPQPTQQRTAGTPEHEADDALRDRAAAAQLVDEAYRAQTAQERQEYVAAVSDMDQDHPQGWTGLSEPTHRFDLDSVPTPTTDDDESGSRSGEQAAEPDSLSIAQQPYDSSQRREALRGHLASTGVDEEAIEARMFADRQNAHSIVEALKGHTATALTGEDDNGNVIAFRQRSNDMER